MGQISLETRVLALAFLCLCAVGNGRATKREDLERAAELAVERAAERAAERAVEKALESGNSTTETETIRESYSSVRKSDKTIQLPASGYTPAQRHEYDRIMREREAAERASAVLKRSVDSSSYSGQLLEEGESDEDSSSSSVSSSSSSEEKQARQSEERNLPETTSPTLDVTRPLPFRIRGYEKPYATATEDDQRQEAKQQRLPSSEGAFSLRDQFPSLYPVKVIAIQTKPYPSKLLRVKPPYVAPGGVVTSPSDEGYPRSIDREVTDTGDSVATEDKRRPGQGWIYR